LTVLAGPAGIGKTQLCLEHFFKLRKDMLYLLPSAEHRERILDLMLRKEGAGFFGERVLTFNRLMQQLLKAGDFALVTDAQSRFLLSDLVTHYAGDYFAAVRDFPGFLETVSDFLGELKESLVSLEQFRRSVARLKKARPEWAAKYDALLKIYEGYENRMEERGLRDHRDGLFLLKEAGTKNNFSLPKFKHLFVDGFFDFSKSQLEFLRWLAERSERITLAMTLDRSPERKRLFEIPLQTLEALEEIGFQTVDLADLPNQRTASPALAHIEKNIFRHSESFARHPEAPKGPKDLEILRFAQDDVRQPPRNDDVLILEATGIRGEIEMIAREIRRLVRIHGYHFSDVAVILRRVGEYANMIRAVFREFEIPVEIHERERLRDTPLARTLVSFFNIFLEDWRREDLFNFLKSSYVQKDYARVCSLELQALRLGIVSGRARWLVELKDPLFEKIASFQDRFQSAAGIEEWLRLTREVLKSFGLSEIPAVYEESARRDFMTLRRLASLFKEIQSAHFAQTLSGKSFEGFVRELLGLIEVDLFSLHDRDKNRVQIYDISLARQKEYKVVFMAGLLEKVFPAEIREDPVLSDEERKTIGLAQKLPRQAVERYFFYLALTRSREKVILTYPRFDLEGREALPSFYVDEVQALFEEPLPKKSYPVNQSLPRLEDAVEERELEAHVIWRLHQKFRKEDKSERAETLGLYNRLLERNSFRELLPRILFEPTERIEDPAVRAAFLPKGGIFTPTRLEAHGRCAYRYFSSEILKLQEDEDRINPRDVGILLHEVLEIYWRERVEKQRKDLEALEPAKAFVLETFHRLLKETPLTGEKAYRIELKIAQMEEWLLGLLESELEGDNGWAAFRPRYFEFEFGFNPKTVGYLKLYDPYQEDLLLRGKIDRIDIDSSGQYALVIDYKTGSSFKKQNLEFGTALQLPLYLLVVQQHLKLKPAGGEIYQINAAKRQGFYSREALAATGTQSRSRSIHDKKEFDAVLERAIHFARKYAEGIKQADISVRPRDCDEHCPYPSLCRIEKWRLPFIYQEIRDEDKRNRTL